MPSCSSPPGALQPSFGPGSFVRHLAQAVARKLDVQVVQTSGLAHDIDEPRDLDRLMTGKQGADAYAFLAAYRANAESRPPQPPRETEL